MFVCIKCDLYGDEMRLAGLAQFDRGPRLFTRRNLAGKFLFSGTDSVYKECEPARFAGMSLERSGARIEVFWLEDNSKSFHRALEER